MLGNGNPGRDLNVNTGAVKHEEPRGIHNHPPKHHLLSIHARLGYLNKIAPPPTPASGFPSPSVAFPTIS